MTHEVMYKRAISNTGGIQTTVLCCLLNVQARPCPFEAWAFGIFVNIFIIGYNSSAKIELALVMDWSGVYGPRLCSSFLSLELFHSAPLKPRSTRTSNEAKQSYEED